MSNDAEPNNSVKQSSDAMCDDQDSKSNIDFNTTIKLSQLPLDVHETDAKLEPDTDSMGSLDEDFNVDADDEEEDDEEEDDELTIREEEDLEDSGEAEDELSSLQQESELPLEQLLQLYGYRVDKPNDDETEPYAKRPRLASTGSDCEQKITLMQQQDQGSDSDSDYVPTVSSSHKEPRVGDEFQCRVASRPPSRASINDGDDLAECLWLPSITDSAKLESFLCKKLNVVDDDIGAQPIPDNQEILRAVLTAAGNVDKISDIDISPNENIFTDADVELFEDGLRIFGKDFYKIQVQKLPHKTVNELVHFYYFWKKTERYDIFASATKLGKSKEFLDEKVTDFMYRITQDIHTLPQQPLMTRECATRSTALSLAQATLGFNGPWSENYSCPQNSTQNTSNSTLTSVSSSDTTSAVV